MFCALRGFVLQKNSAIALLIYTDLFPTFMIGGRKVSLKVTSGVRVCDSPLARDCSPPVMSLDGHNQLPRFSSCGPNLLSCR